LDWRLFVSDDNRGRFLGLCKSKFQARRTSEITANHFENIGKAVLLFRNYVP
jgi:hypothetical protein